MLLLCKKMDLEWTCKEFSHVPLTSNLNSFWTRGAFPSLFLKRDNLTYAIFSSGSINIIGAKSREDIESKIDYVIEKCMECVSKNE